MKKKMLWISGLSLAGLLVSAAAYRYTGDSVLFSLAITFGTVFYHLAVRLAVGLWIDATLHNHVDYTKKWFREKPFEKKLYETLQVKKWKKHMPTFNPEEFQLQNRSAEEIIQVTCQSEIVHELNVLLSFVPLLFSVWFGSLGVFLITSCGAALFDSLFVIMQRYNRPRLMRLMGRADTKPQVN